MSAAPFLRSLFLSLRKGGLLLAIAAGLSLASCAGKFNADWNKAVAAQKTAPPKGLLGAWDGSWLSATNGHKGRLRCLVEPGPTPKQYQFRYHAVWAGVLSGGFTSDTLVQPSSSGGYALSSHEDLGAFGTFDQKGTATPQKMDSRYTSSMGDHGTFSLRRPE